MKLRPLSLLALAVVAMLGGSTSAATFYPISSVASNTVNFFAVENLIQGPGVGFDAAAPHDTLGSGLTWVTDAPGGFPSDYIAVAGTPVLTLDLGAEYDLGSIASWGYNATNANGTSQFSLRFATSAEGTAGFGSSITYNPTFSLINDHTIMQLSEFSEVVKAQYVEYTVLDTFFVAPGDGSGGNTPGGDRAGLGEIAFPAVPEPSSIALMAVASAAGLLALRRR